MADWRDNLIDDTEGLLDILENTRRIAVLGIRNERRPYLPAYFVPAYLVAAGFEVIPLPVYERDVEVILGQPVFLSLNDVPGEIDLLVVFRRAEQLPEHLNEIISRHPKAVWLQTGIFDDNFAQQVASAGIKVVQDRCVAVDHRRLKAQLQKL